jgi:hypothetical protein
MLYDGFLKQKNLYDNNEEKLMMGNKNDDDD